MFHIPCRLPMPNKKQGLFHATLRTFRYVQLLEPELYAPAPEARANTQMYPQYMYPAVSIADELI